MEPFLSDVPNTEEFFKKKRPGQHDLVPNKHHEKFKYKEGATNCTEEELYAEMHKKVKYKNKKTQLSECQANESAIPDGKLLLEEKSKKKEHKESRRYKEKVKHEPKEEKYKKKPEPGVRPNQDAPSDEKHKPMDAQILITDKSHRLGHKKVSRKRHHVSVSSEDVRHTKDKRSGYMLESKSNRSKLLSKSETNIKDEVGPPVLSVHMRSKHENEPKQVKEVVKEAVKKPDESKRAKPPRMSFIDKIFFGRSRNKKEDNVQGRLSPKEDKAKAEKEKKQEEKEKSAKHGHHKDNIIDEIKKFKKKHTYSKSKLTDNKHKGKKSAEEALLHVTKSKSTHLLYHIVLEHDKLNQMSKELKRKDEDSTARTIRVTADELVAAITQMKKKSSLMQSKTFCYKLPVQNRHSKTDTYKSNNSSLSDSPLVVNCTHVNCELQKGSEIEKKSVGKDSTISEESFVKQLAKPLEKNSTILDVSGKQLLAKSLEKNSTVSDVSGKRLVNSVEKDTRSTNSEVSEKRLIKSLEKDSTVSDISERHLFGKETSDAPDSCSFTVKGVEPLKVLKPNEKSNENVNLFNDTFNFLQSTIVSITEVHPLLQTSSKELSLHIQPSFPFETADGKQNTESLSQQQLHRTHKFLLSNLTEVPKPFHTKDFAAESDIIPMVTELLDRGNDVQSVSIGCQNEESKFNQEELATIGQEVMCLMKEHVKDLKKPTKRELRSMVEKLLKKRQTSIDDARPKKMKNKRVQVSIKNKTESLASPTLNRRRYLSRGKSPKQDSSSTKFKPPSQPSLETYTKSFNFPFYFAHSRPRKPNQKLNVREAEKNSFVPEYHEFLEDPLYGVYGHFLPTKERTRGHKGSEEEKLQRKNPRLNFSNTYHYDSLNNMFNDEMSPLTRIAEETSSQNSSKRGFRSDRSRSGSRKSTREQRTANEDPENLLKLYQQKIEEALTGDDITKILQMLASTLAEDARPAPSIKDYDLPRTTINKPKVSSYQDPNIRFHNWDSDSESPRAFSYGSRSDDGAKQKGAHAPGSKIPVKKESPETELRESSQERRATSKEAELFRPQKKELSMKIENIKKLIGLESIKIGPKTSAGSDRSSTPTRNTSNTSINQPDNSSRHLSSKEMAKIADLVKASVLEEMQSKEKSPTELYQVHEVAFNNLTEYRAPVIQEHIFKQEEKNFNATSRDKRDENERKQEPVQKKTSEATISREKKSEEKSEATNNSKKKEIMHKLANIVSDDVDMFRLQSHINALLSYKENNEVGKTVHEENEISQNPGSSTLSESTEEKKPIVNKPNKEKGGKRRELPQRPKSAQQTSQPPQKNSKIPTLVKTPPPQRGSGPARQLVRSKTDLDEIKRERSERSHSLERRTFFGTVKSAVEKEKETPTVSAYERRKQYWNSLRMKTRNTSQASSVDGDKNMETHDCIFCNPTSTPAKSSSVRRSRRDMSRGRSRFDNESMEHDCYICAQLSSRQAITVEEDYADRPRLKILEKHIVPALIESVISNQKAKRSVHRNASDATTDKHPGHVFYTYNVVADHPHITEFFKSKFDIKERGNSLTKCSCCVDSHRMPFDFVGKDFEDDKTEDQKIKAFLNNCTSERDFIPVKDDSENSNKKPSLQLLLHPKFSANKILNDTQKVDKTDFDKYFSHVELDIKRSRPEIFPVRTKSCLEMKEVCSLSDSGYASSNTKSLRKFLLQPDVFNSFTSDFQAGDELSRRLSTVTTYPVKTDYSKSSRRRDCSFDSNTTDDIETISSEKGFDEPEYVQVKRRPSCSREREAKVISTQEGKLETCRPRKLKKKAYSETEEPEAVFLCSRHRLMLSQKLRRPENESKRCSKHREPKKTQYVLFCKSEEIWRSDSEEESLPSEEEENEDQRCNDRSEKRKLHVAKGVAKNAEKKKARTPRSVKFRKEVRKTSTPVPATIPPQETPQPQGPFDKAVQNLKREMNQCHEYVDKMSNMSRMREQGHLRQFVDFQEMPLSVLLGKAQPAKPPTAMRSFKQQVPRIKVLDNVKRFPEVESFPEKLCPNYISQVKSAFNIEAGTEDPFNQKFEEQRRPEQYQYFGKSYLEMLNDTAALCKELQDVLDRTRCSNLACRHLISVLKDQRTPETNAKLRNLVDKTRCNNDGCRQLRSLISKIERVTPMPVIETAPPAAVNIQQVSKDIKELKVLLDMIFERLINSDESKPLAEESRTFSAEIVESAKQLLTLVFDELFAARNKSCHDLHQENLLRIPKESLVSLRQTLDTVMDKMIDQASNEAVVGEKSSGFLKNREVGPYDILKQTVRPNSKESLVEKLRKPFIRSRLPIRIKSGKRTSKTHLSEHISVLKLKTKQSTVQVSSSDDPVKKISNLDVPVQENGDHKTAQVREASLSKVIFNKLLTISNESVDASFRNIIALPAKITHQKLDATQESPSHTRNVPVNVSHSGLSNRSMSESRLDIFSGYSTERLITVQTIRVTRSHSFPNILKKKKGKKTKEDTTEKQEEETEPKHRCGTTTCNYHEEEEEDETPPPSTRCSRGGLADDNTRRDFLNIIEKLVKVSQKNKPSQRELDAIYKDFYRLNDKLAGCPGTSRSRDSCCLGIEGHETCKVNTSTTSLHEDFRYCMDLGPSGCGVSPPDWDAPPSGCGMPSSGCGTSPTYEIPPSGCGMGPFPGCMPPPPAVYIPVPYPDYGYLDFQQDLMRFSGSKKAVENKDSCTSDVDSQTSLVSKADERGADANANADGGGINLDEFVRRQQMMDNMLRKMIIDASQRKLKEVVDELVAASKESCTEQKEKPPLNLKCEVYNILPEHSSTETKRPKLRQLFKTRPSSAKEKGKSSKAFIEDFKTYYKSFFKKLHTCEKRFGCEKESCTSMKKIEDSFKEAALKKHRELQKEQDDCVCPEVVEYIEGQLGIEKKPEDLYESEQQPKTNGTKYKKSCSYSKNGNEGVCCSKKEDVEDEVSDDCCRVKVIKYSTKTIPVEEIKSKCCKEKSNVSSSKREKDFYKKSRRKDCCRSDSDEDSDEDVCCSTKKKRSASSFSERESEEDCCRRPRHTHRCPSKDAKSYSPVVSPCYSPARSPSSPVISSCSIPSVDSRQGCRGSFRNQGSCGGRSHSHKSKKSRPAAEDNVASSKKKKKPKNEKNKDKAVNFTDGYGYQDFDASSSTSSTSLEEEYQQRRKVQKSDKFVAEKEESEEHIACTCGKPPTECKCKEKRSVSCEDSRANKKRHNHPCGKRSSSSGVRSCYFFTQELDASRRFERIEKVEEPLSIFVYQNTEVPDPLKSGKTKCCNKCKQKAKNVKDVLSWPPKKTYTSIAEERQIIKSVDVPDRAVKREENKEFTLSKQMKNTETMAVEEKLAQKEEYIDFSSKNEITVQRKFQSVPSNVDRFSVKEEIKKAHTTTAQETPKNIYKEKECTCKKKEQTSEDLKKENAKESRKDTSSFFIKKANLKDEITGVLELSSKNSTDDAETKPTVYIPDKLLQEACNFSLSTITELHKKFCKKRKGATSMKSLLENLLTNLPTSRPDGLTASQKDLFKLLQEFTIEKGPPKSLQFSQQNKPKSIIKKTDDEKVTGTLDLQSPPTVTKDSEEADLITINLSSETPSKVTQTVRPSIPPIEKKPSTPERGISAPLTISKKELSIPRTPAEQAPKLKQVKGHMELPDPKDNPLNQLKENLTDKELFEKLLDSYEKEQNIVEKLSDDVDFFQDQLHAVNSKESALELVRNRSILSKTSEEKLLEELHLSSLSDLSRHTETSLQPKKDSLTRKRSSKFGRLFKKDHVKDIVPPSENRRPSIVMDDLQELDSSKVKFLKKANRFEQEKKIIGPSTPSAVNNSIQKVDPSELGHCFLRGFRSDHVSLRGDTCLIIKDQEKEHSKAPGSFVEFSERDTPLDFLLALGFSIDEASNAIKDDDVRNRLFAAITEARIWINKISAVQGTLLYLIAYKTKPKVMRYYLQLVEAIINKRIKTAVQVDAFIRILEKVEDGDITIVSIIGTEEFADEENEEKMVKKQLRELFIRVYHTAENEALLKGKPLTKEAVVLLRILSAKYRAGLDPHLELIARYIGQDLLLTEVQLEAAMIYLSKLNSAMVNLPEFEQYCGIECKDKGAPQGTANH